MNFNPEFGERTNRRDILGFPVYDLSWASALSFAGELANLVNGQARIAFLNANNANYMQTDPDYRRVIGEQMVLPDGVGMDLACYFLNGRKFRANLNGTDFVPALLTYISEPKRIGLIGSTPAILQAAAEGFRAHAPWHAVIPVSDGYFDKNNCQDVIDRLAASKLDILLVGMGTPLQEKWVHDHIQPEHARLVLSVGALFDFVSGAVPRAPLAIRRMRLEWAYRIVCEPRRLWRRYIVGGPVFLARLVHYRLTRSRPPNLRPPARPQSFARRPGSGGRLRSPLR